MAAARVDKLRQPLDRQLTGMLLEMLRRKTNRIRYPTITIAAAAMSDRLKCSQLIHPAPGPAGAVHARSHLTCLSHSASSLGVSAIIRLVIRLAEGMGTLLSSARDPTFGTWASGCVGIVAPATLMMSLTFSRARKVTEQTRRHSDAEA